jgi:dihydrodipicolinate synthase/N-acetylneuraminate lyase
VVGQIVVPALAFRTPDGKKLDVDATRLYAERAAHTWTDAFILSGSTTRGDLLSVDQRSELLDLWSDLLPVSRLVACCWGQRDVGEAIRRGITPMVVMNTPRNDTQALSLLASLPPDAYVYSHPKYGARVFDATLTARARQQGVLPAGAKLSKVTTSDIAAIRRAAGPEFALWDGSSRRIAASLAAGASGVVAGPLSHFPIPFPDCSLRALQLAIDTMQRQLDRLPTREARTSFLAALASEERRDTPGLRATA